MVERAAVGSRVAALVSGLDSCIMAGLLAREYAEVTPLFVRAGLRWEDAELAALERFFSALDAPAVRPIVELAFDIRSVYGSHWSVGGSDVPDAQQPDEVWYLPGRNLLLLGAAALYGGVHETPNLAIGLLASNPFPDATTEFLRSLERTAGLAMDTSFSGADAAGRHAQGRRDPGRGGHAGGGGAVLRQPGGRAALRGVREVRGAAAGVYRRGGGGPDGLC